LLIEGFWTRVSALTIDEIILVALTYILMQIIKSLIIAGLLHSVWFIILFYEFLDYNYYTLLWVFGGQTQEKKVMKSKLINLVIDKLNLFNVYSGEEQHWI
jgi:uncharacterized RDD family membrane protein YckC